jgi:hypothetical protein
VQLTPHILVREVSDMGRREVHTFSHRERELLVVQRSSLHHQWVRLPYAWEGPASLAAVRVANGPDHPTNNTDWGKLKLAMQSGLRQLPAVAVETVEQMMAALLTAQGIAMLLLVVAVFVAGGEVALVCWGRWPSMTC